MLLFALKASPLPHRVPAIPVFVWAGADVNLPCFYA